MIKILKTAVKLLSFIFFFLLVSSNIPEKNDFSTERIKRNVEYLSSSKLGGRKAGSQGDLLAAEYIRKEFKKLDLKLLENKGFQRFEIVTGVRIEDGTRLAFNNYSALLGTEFQPYSFSANTSLQAEAVFAGYGFNIKKDTFFWNDFEDHDVKGKWVIMLDGEPRIRMLQSFFSEQSDLRSKVLNATDQGAGGILIINTNGENPISLEPLFLDRIMAVSNVPVFQINRQLADRILSVSSIKTDSLISKIINEKKPVTTHIPLLISGTSSIQMIKSTTQNVIALLEGSDPILKNEYIVVGAHYDHLGMGGYGSGSRQPDTLALHPGADDNASGVTGIIELAAKLVSQKKMVRRSVVFVAFAAEEIGLLGSKYFVNHPPFPVENIKAMLNFDMIGRYRKEKNELMISGSGTSKESDSLLTLYGNEHGLNLNKNPDGSGASDHASFYLKKIPVFFISSGAHPDYHSPNDVSQKIDYEGMLRILSFSYDLLMDVASMKDPLTFTESESYGASEGRGYKVTLGIIPDFAANKIQGMRVESVRKGAPAATGGMKDGDVIVAVEGMPVGNIYDYMARLKSLRKGQIITVDVLREGQKIVLIIQL